MRNFDLTCPECGKKTLTSKNHLFICNNCGYAPNGYSTIKCPICNNYEYKMKDGVDICNTCGWRFAMSEINESVYREKWKQRQQNLSKITSGIKYEIENYFKMYKVIHNDLNFYEMVTNLYNYLFKVTLPQKYTVIFSDEIEAKSEYKELITLFKKKLEDGENIIPWQSRTVLKANYQDILFNFWNIKHLHLIEDPNKRSNNILLYIQCDSTVYFLDVVKHPKGDEWNNFNILRTVCRNHWMQYIGFDKISDIEPDFVEGTLEPKIEDEEAIRKIYKKNINMGFTIDGISYWPNPFQGVVRTGDNKKAIDNTKRLYEKLKKLSIDS